MSDEERAREVANAVCLRMFWRDAESEVAWKPGLPPGPYYDGMVDDFEIAFAPMATWHRRRSPEHAAEHREDRLALAAELEKDRADGQ
ncbi:MAG: hypothetical protein EBR82_48275 [Caulobacteraceae bacterium]|nr:hypothetical protein [Caulobacteraceae bacterium]